ncbi:MAG TPA: ParB/RepB/Spo0J family partition protein [Armatimonadota bacterium]|nr:ParB/RepB/Spo0J family partition protein [Armatimonadota bacterium]
METISIHDLILDRTLNPRLDGVDTDVVEYYASIFKDVVWPPILVDRATNKLLDGWHRVEAAKRAGVYTLPVQWVDAKEEELFALAVKANLGHGVHLRKEERYKAIARMQREGWTNERIAEFLNCSLAMTNKTEKAEDLRIKFKVDQHPGAALPIETLVEVTRLPQEYHEEIAELACEVEAVPADVRRTVRAIKKGEVETPQDIRRMMTDPEFAKAKKAGAPTVDGDNWLMTFATLADQLETTQISITPMEHEAAVALFKRVRLWVDRQLSRLGVEETPSML